MSNFPPIGAGLPRLMQQPTVATRRPSHEGMTNFVLGLSALGIILSDLDAQHAGRAVIAYTLGALLVTRLWGAE